MRALPNFLIPLLALTASSAMAQETATIPVQLSNFKFTPNQIVLEHGQPYVLRLTNAASGGHNFDAQSFFASATVAPADRALIKGGTIEVPAGQVREIHLVANAPGQYDLKCSHFLHAGFGMKGTIVVR
ncbi:MAG TPA: cupredoxin domain-containing protein [Sphingomicrobium sp.]|nr:cupredoxin domain-containing protein [Sphingomicrobium sp.]